MESIGLHPEDRSWLSQLAFRRPSAPPPPHVTFADLARIHNDWRHQPDDPVQTQRYHDALAAFEHHEGRIEEAHWCVDRASGAAVTAVPMRKTLGARPRYRFHRVSSWATQPNAEVAQLLNTCDELGTRAAQVLRGTSARICMGLLMNSTKNLLGVVDSPSQPTDPAESAKLVASERKTIDGIAKEYKRTAARQVQLVYLAGAVAGILMLTLVVLFVLWLVSRYSNAAWLPKDHRGGAAVGQHVSLTMIYLCAIAGAIGAIVSLIARINANSCSVDCEAGRIVTFLLGSLRPVLGAVFGLAFYAALVSGLLELFKVPADADRTKQFFFFLVIAFLAGFSERWARDVLVDLEGSPPAPVPANAPPAT